MSRPYYLDGWTDPQLGASRDICFSSATHCVEAIENIFEMTKDNLDKVQGKKKDIAGGVWFFIFNALQCSALHVQHLKLLNDCTPINLSAQGRNYDTEKAVAIQSLKVMKNILYVLSSQSAIARSGLESLFVSKTGTEGKRIQKSHASASITKNTGIEFDHVIGGNTYQGLAGEVRQDDAIGDMSHQPFVNSSQNSVFNVLADGISDEQFWALMAYLDSSITTNNA